MTTFLEYVLARAGHLGPPTRTRGDGQSEWPCPLCGKDKFHTLPHDPRHKDRARCWSCGFRGDLMDMLQHFHPGSRYPDRLAMEADLLREYQEGGYADDLATTAAPSSRSRGSGTSGCPTCDPDAADDLDGPGVAEAADEADDLLPEGVDPAGPDGGRFLLFAAAVIRAAFRRGANVQAVAEHLELHEWCRRTDFEHAVGCEEPDCDWHVCRGLRGVTHEQFVEEAREWQAAQPGFEPDSFRPPRRRPVPRIGCNGNHPRPKGR